MTIGQQSLIPPKNVLSQLAGTEDRINLLILAFFYGSYFLLGTILTNITGAREHDEFSIFVQGWIIVPALTIFSIGWVYKIKQTTFQEDGSFIPILLGVNTAFGLFAIFGLYVALHLNNPAQALTPLILRIIFLFPLVQIITFWGVSRFRNSPVVLKLVLHKSAIYWLIPPGVGIIMMMFSGLFATYEGYILPLRSLLVAIPFGFLAYLHKYLVRVPTKKNQTILAVLAITLVIGACFDPLISIDNHHENFYIGPINALLHGKTMLVDVYSQYGVLVHEFLAVFFKLNLLPLNYQGLAFLVALCSMVQYVLVYFLIRVLTKSARFSLVVLSIVLLMNLFASMGIVQAYPSTGPVRFGLCYVLITLVALRLKYPARKSVFLWLEYGIFGIASIWSFETFVYTGTIFYGIRIYESIVSTNSISSFFKNISLVFSKSILAISLFHLIQALTVFFASGVWPNWAYYFEFIYTYSVAGFGTLPIDVWSPWFIIVAIYYIGLIYPFITWIVTKRWDPSIETQVILCLAFFGVAQFTYYLGRSHPNNLFHICAPAILIAGYGASQIRLPDHRKHYYRLRYRHGYGTEQITLSKNIKYKSARYMAIFVVYAAIAFLFITYTPFFFQKISNTGFGFVYSMLNSKDSSKELLLGFSSRLWQPGPVLPQTFEAVELVKKYAPNKPRVMLFLSPSEATTETLFRSHKAQIYPVTELRQDGYASKVSNFIVSYSPDLQIGDVIFLPTQPEGLALPFDFPGDNYKYPLMIVLKLCNQFGFSVIESSSSGVIVLRLEPLGNGTSDYCARASVVNANNP